MKVLLINPPSKNEILSCNPDFINKERGHNPPLGLLYLAAYIEKFSNFGIKVLDCQVEESNYDQIAEFLAKEKPDVIGMTAMTFTLIDVLEVVKIAKRINLQTKIVLGGTHPFIYPEETINLPDIDYLILGEGEISFLELLKHLDKKTSEPPKDIKGLVFKIGNEVIKTGLGDLLMDLDQLPFPARHLTPYQKYTSLLAKKNPTTTMITSRGCPYRCIFCDRPNLGKVFRARSAKNVVDEMEKCEKMGINEILMYDDTFTVNQQRVLDICAEYQKRKLKVAWDIRARVDTISEEMLRELKKSNCQRIHYGIEAGTEKILKVLRKGITLEQIEKAFKLTKKAGIPTLGYFMIGNPEETREDIMATIKFAKKIKPDFVQITITTPFPRTDLYEIGLQKKILADDYMRKFAQNPTDKFEIRYWEENFNKEELNNLLTYAYKTFYWRPSFLIKELFQIRSLGELKKKLKAGLSLLSR